MNARPPKMGKSRAEQEKALRFLEGLVVKERQRLTLPRFTVVPSALAGLTALFGMGRGDPRRYSHLKLFGDPGR